MKDLIANFKQTKSNEVFGEIYKKVSPIIEEKKKYFLSKGFEEHDITEGCDEALLESIEKWDENKSGFMTFFRVCSDRRIINVSKKRSSRYRRELYEPGDWEDDSITFFDLHSRFEDLPTVEDNVMEKAIRSDQRQLIASILQEVDEQLRQQLLIISSGRSANYAAKKFEMHPQTLSRKLSKISSAYNSKWRNMRLQA